VVTCFNYYFSRDVIERGNRGTRIPVITPFNEGASVFARRDDLVNHRIELKDLGACGSNEIFESIPFRPDV